MPPAPSTAFVLSVLRAHREELHAAGLRHVSLFGSVSRGENGPESDIDLLAELEPAAHLGIFGLITLQRHLSFLLSRNVDLIAAPIEDARLRKAIERDAMRAF